MANSGICFINSNALLQAWADEEAKLQRSLISLILLRSRKAKSTRRVRVSSAQSTSTVQGIAFMRVCQERFGELEDLEGYHPVQKDKP